MGMIKKSVGEMGWKVAGAALPTAPVLAKKVWAPLPPLPKAPPTAPEAAPPPTNYWDWLPEELQENILQLRGWCDEGPLVRASTFGPSVGEYRCRQSDTEPNPTVLRDPVTMPHPELWASQNRELSRIRDLYDRDAYRCTEDGLWQSPKYGSSDGQKSYLWCMFEAPAPGAPPGAERCKHTLAFAVEDGGRTAYDKLCAALTAATLERLGAHGPWERARFDPLAWESKRQAEQLHRQLLQARHELVKAKDDSSSSLSLLHPTFSTSWEQRQSRLRNPSRPNHQSPRRPALRAALPHALPQK